jgi:hypothetical protein
MVPVSRIVLKAAFALLPAVVAVGPMPCSAEELVTTAHYANGDQVPYILDSKGPAPEYVLILFPGGQGTVDPHVVDGQLVYGYRSNFLLRARRFFVDERFATVTTNTTQSEQRIQAVLDDIKARFPAAKIYLVGTSSGTYATMALAGYLSDKIAGEIHSSSLSNIRNFDSRKYKNRQLIIHHVKDACRLTVFSDAKSAHDKYGTDFIAMEGGVARGDPCEPFGHHGYNGIERETTDAIKKWIVQGS